MSYSFSAKGASKTDAILDAEAKFEKVVTDMPVHGLDKAAVGDNLRKCIDIVREPQPDEEVTISMNGYIVQSNPTAGPSGVTTVAINCSVSVGRKVA